MFMQAGFAFLEAGLTRMKNAAHIAGKNVLIFGVCSLVYWAVGFGLAFGDGNVLIGPHGFFPSTQAMIAVGQKPFDWFSEIPGVAGYLFEVVFAGVSLAIVWGAMAERAKLWVYFVFGVWFTITYSVVSHWIWSPHGWLFHHGMQDFAGSTVVHYQGALAGLAGALILGPRIGKFGTDGRVGAVAVHGMSGVWGTLATGLFAVPALASKLATGSGGLVYTGSFHQLGVQALGVVAVGAFSFSTSFGVLFALHKVWGIRVEEHVEAGGLDVHEHGMWGYPEFYIPVPGGYGTEAHSHLGVSHHPRPAAPVHAASALPEPG